MANSFRTARPVKSEKRAVASVMPAEGPSFGVAPSGTWIWKSYFRKISGEILNSAALLRMKLNAAAALSFMTFPSDPVSLSSPFPGIMIVSTGRIVPPVEVQASPVATPICGSRSASSERYFGTPRYLRTSSTEISASASGSKEPSTTFRAILRRTEAMERSSERTPASRV